MSNLWLGLKPYHWTALLLLTAFLVHNVNACSNGSSSVGDCLHTYLERDFPSIEAIVFPKKRRRPDESVLLLDGPELEDQCHRIGEVVECLEELLPTCHYYDEFFPFRRLVTTLRKSIDWVCSRDHLRSRFRSLLNAFNCLETARQHASSSGQLCFHPHIPINIWQRIIRLQSGTEVCNELVSHVNCTQRFMTGCPKEGEAAYQDLNLLFLNAWCMETKMFPSRADALLSSITTFKIAILAVSYVYHRLI